MNTLKNNTGRYVAFIFLSLTGALGNMSILYLVNEIVANVVSGKETDIRRYALFFAAALTVFFICRWIVSAGIINFTQRLLRKTRMGVLTTLLKSSYMPLVNNKERIYSAMTRDTGNIVQASVSIVDIMANAIITIICFVYMGFLSWKLLLCVLGLLIFTVGIYMLSERKGNKLFSQAMQHEDKFIKYLNEILSGFKQIVMDRRKGTEIKDKHIAAALDSTVALNKKALVSYLNNRVIGQLSFYVFIGLLLLFLGKMLHVPPVTIVSFVFTVLFVFGPIETTIVLLPGISQASASLKRLSSLEKDLTEVETEETEVKELLVFEELSMKEMTYSYASSEGGEKPFQVGPLNFRLERGSVIFICGGNGSGKTTFVNLLTGLYSSSSGAIFVNGKKENPQSPAYRNLFAPVFSDFHLFEECFGMPQADPVKVQEYLKLFELDTKVSFDNNKFTTVNLSAGQRKRLALISAMLEKKPVLVLDEFAADQDPQFRKKFYTDIIDYIIKEGFTIVAVTHDDHYFSCCDSIFKMDDGMLQVIGKESLLALQPALV